MAVKLSSPWVLYYHKIQAFFSEDREIRILFDNEDISLSIYVDNEEKADALFYLLPHNIDFGGVHLSISIIPSNKMVIKKRNANPTLIDVAAALENNEAVDSFHSTEIYSNPMYYVVFKNKVVQYFTDDLGDYYGIRSTLYEELAREIFRPVDNVYYCTAPDGLVDSSKEWDN